MAALLLLGAAFAQPLAKLAPADAVLTLGLTPQETRIDTLAEDLSKLDWEGAGATLEALLTAAADDPSLSDIADLRGILDGFGDPGALLSELEGICPQLPDVAAAIDLKGLADDYLLTVSLTPFNPLPSVTAFAHVTDESLAAAAGLEDALVSCFASETPLEQDDTPIYVLADGSDFPIVIASLDHTFMIGSNPDVLRAAIRLASGSDEPSLADTPLWQATQRFNPGGLSFSLNLAGLVDALQGLAGPLIDGPDSERLVERVSAALRTVGGIAGRLGTTPEGILLETAVAVNPDGGDNELADLLLCRQCAVSRPSLAPESSVSVSSTIFPLREVIDYLQGWLDDLAPLAGENLDIRGMLDEQLGLDLDRALLDWLGGEIHMVELEPLSPDLRSLLFQPARAVLIPVSSSRRAQEGLEMLATALEPFAGELVTALDPISSLLKSFGGADIQGTFSTRTYSYQGIDIHQLRSGFGFDVGLTFVGNTLVVSSPAKAAERIIDTFRGGRSILDNPDYRSVIAASPANAAALSYANTQASVRGIAELLKLGAQPLAFVISAGLQRMTAPPPLVDNFNGDLGPANLSGIEASDLTTPGSTEGILEEADANNFSEYSDYYRLSGLEAGDEVNIEMTSEDFDTYLYLIDADAEIYLDANDDAPDISRSEINFTAEDGVTYWVEVTSFSGQEAGSYNLSVAVSSGGPSLAEPGSESPPPPSFAELLNLTGILPEALGVLADHLSFSEGFTAIDGDTLYSRALTRIRW